MRAISARHILYATKNLSSVGDEGENARFNFIAVVCSSSIIVVVVVVVVVVIVVVSR